MICQRQVDSGRTIGRVDTDLLFCILRYNEQDPENGGRLIHGSIDPIPASHNICFVTSRSAFMRRLVLHGGADIENGL
jgi:hypothetical protein